MNKSIMRRISWRSLWGHLPFQILDHFKPYNPWIELSRALKKTSEDYGNMSKQRKTMPRIRVMTDDDCTLYKRPRKNHSSQCWGLPNWLAQKLRSSSVSGKWRGPIAGTRTYANFCRQHESICIIYHTWHSCTFIVLRFCFTKTLSIIFYPPKQSKTLSDPKTS